MLDSFVRLHRIDENNAGEITSEHRAAAATDPLRLQLVAGEDVDAHLAIVAAATSADGDPPGKIDRRVIDLLARAARPLSRSQLRAELTPAKSALATP